MDIKECGVEGGGAGFKEEGVGWVVGFNEGWGG